MELRQSNQQLIAWDKGGLLGLRYEMHEGELVSWAIPNW